MFPSIEKGIVTIATVNALFFLAISATTGAAPVPVPPPKPQVMKTKSQPAIAFLISPSLSLAASSPTLGLEPAPKPFVNSFPIKIFIEAFVYNKS